MSLSPVNFVINLLGKVSVTPLNILVEKAVATDAPRFTMGLHLDKLNES